ncbi:MAG TPA: hypothetical protein VLA83_08000 [Candidatus Binatia bacterium]|nr:hypothetical protein [Candidatus Binatia bacterium]
MEWRVTLDALSKDASKSQQRPANTMNSGQLVLVTLQNPREKFWGMLLALTPAGASLRGVDLQSFDDFVQMVKAGEAMAANTVFFPMHRVQRMEVDARNGGLPSLADQFVAKTGFDVNKFFQDQQ